MDHGQFIQKGKEWVEAKTGEKVELYAESMGWMAFMNDSGKICVIANDILHSPDGELNFKFAKPSANMRRNLNLH